MGASYGLTACAHLQSRVPGPCWPKNSHLFVCLHVSGLAVLPLEPTHSLTYSFIHPLHPTHASRSVRAPPRKPARIDPDDCDRQRGPSLYHPPVCKNGRSSVELHCAAARCCCQLRLFAVTGRSDRTKQLLLRNGRDSLRELDSILAAVPCLALPGDVLLDSSLFRPLSLVHPLLTKKAPTAQRHRRPSLPHPACLALAAPHSSSSFFSSSFSSSSNQDSQLDKRSAPTPRHVRLPPGRLSLLVPSLLGRGKPAQSSVPQCRARRRTSHFVSVPVQSRRARTSAPAREIQPRAHPLAHSPAQVPATPVSPSSPRAPSPPAQPSPSSKH